MDSKRRRLQPDKEASGSSPAKKSGSSVQPKSTIFNLLVGKKLTPQIKQPSSANENPSKIPQGTKRCKSVLQIPTWHSLLKNVQVVPPVQSSPIETANDELNQETPADPQEKAASNENIALPLVSNDLPLDTNQEVNDEVPDDSHTNEVDQNPAITPREKENEPSNQVEKTPLDTFLNSETLPEENDISPPAPTEHDYCQTTDAHCDLPSAEEVEFQPIVYVVDDYKLKPSDVKPFRFSTKRGQKRERYKKGCYVPFCNNNSRDNPTINFFPIPRVAVLREQFFLLLKWTYPRYFQKLKRNLPYATSIYACEKHYNLENDVEDLNAVPMKLKEGVLPSKIKRIIRNKQELWTECEEKILNAPASKLLQQPTYIRIEKPEPETIITNAVPLLDGKKRGRGRPRKHPQQPSKEYSESEDSDEDDDIVDDGAKDKNSDESDTSWEGKEIDEEELTEIETDAIIAGKTMRTRRDVKITDWELLTSFISPPNPNAVKKPKNPMPCRFCSATFMSLKERMKHINEVHKTMECDKCLKVFDTYKLFMSHMKTHYQRKKLVCPFCELEFYHRFKLEEHTANHFKDMEASENIPSPIQLGETEPEFGDEFAGEFAMPSDYTIQIACPKCPELLQSEKHYIIHMAKHGLVYTCDICSETVMEWANINNHLQKHLGAGNEDMKICDC